MAGDPFDLDVGDLNGDGKPDLVAACMPVGQDPGKVSVLLNTGTGTFAVQQPLLEVGQNLTAVRLLHLNPGTETGQDSHLDIAVARTTEHEHDR